MKYDYGDPARGLSFEHTNIYDTLAHMGHDVIYFDFMSEFQQRGREAMSRRLVDIVQAEKPQLLFCVLFTDQFDIDRLKFISDKTDTQTFNWFCDDHWRFDNYSRFWAPAFNWVSTTAGSALPKYKAIGYTNVIKTQWACNHFLYQPLDLPKKYDVTFIGQPHGNRRETIAMLRRAGLDVETWGFGWENGRVEQDHMIAIFCQSRVNLNLSNSSISRRRRLLQRALKLQLKSTHSQIKGRNFEVPGCRTFLLTDPADNLDSYYTPGKEIGVFENARRLVERTRYYLQHETVRESIALEGYHRTIRDHTYERRFNDIFASMGLLAVGEQ